MKKLLTVITLLLFAININAQNPQLDSNQVLSPNGIFDEVFDNYGNKYSLEEIRINTALDSVGVQKAALLCSAGYFDLYFEANSGMDGTSTVEVDRRNVICQLFNDLSQFIVPANPSVKVNIWVRDISNIIPNPSSSGVLGLASGFYTVPAGAPTFNGIADNEIWKTINSGTNSYTNVSSPLTSLGGPNASFYHGMMAFNFSNPSINWHTNLTQTTNANLYDMYSVALHETTHALGFASLIDVNGDSKFGTTFPYYSRYDLFLKTPTNLPLITNSGSCSLYGFGFNTALNPNVMTPSPFNCSTHIQFAGSVNQAVYTPSVFAPPSSLSHFEDLCHTPNPYPDDEYYVMSNANGTGAVYMKRYLKPEERAAICDLGYQVNTTFGNAPNLNFFNYGGTVCPGVQVAGINDGIDPSGSFQNIVTVGSPITLSFTDILQNDFNAASFECLEDIYGNGTLSTTSGTSFTYNATSPGVALLRYIPVSSTGNRGNITYIFIYVQSGNCNVSTCDLINNGGFENGTNCGALYAPPASCPGLLPPDINCWAPLSATPDYYVRGCSVTVCATGTGLTVPTNYCSPTADTWNSSTTNNDKMLGVASLNYSPNSLNEAIQASLSTPLHPNISYTLRFVARVANNYPNNVNLPGVIEFAGSPNLLAPIGFFYSSTPAPLTSLAQITVPNNNAWNSFSVTITNTTSTPFNFMSIINAGYLNSNPVNTRNYVLIDDVSIVENSQLGTFNLPTTSCINQTLPDLSIYANPPGGVFVGNGIIFNAGIYSFDASVAGAGNHIITYTYTSSTGCVYELSSTITVINANFNLSATASPATVCSGATSTLTASGVNINPPYVWNPGNFSGNPYMVTPPTNTTYTVTGTDVNGCIGTATTTVSVITCSTNPGCNLPATLTIPTTGALSSTFPIPNGSVVDVLGTFTIDLGNAVYTDVKFRMAPGVLIDVLPGNALTLETCHLFSCTQLWKGIKLNQGASVVVKDYSIIEDAIIAIDWVDGNNVKINNSILNKNGAGLSLSNTATTNGIDINNTIFTCRNLDPFVYTFNFNAIPFVFNLVKGALYNDNISFAPYATLLAPAPANTRSKYGVFSNQVETTIGQIGGNNISNLFDYLDYGIYVDNANFHVYNNRFANCFGDNSGIEPVGIGVFAKTKDPNTIDIGGNNINQRNIFRNCYRGAHIDRYFGINFINNRVLNDQTSPNFTGTGSYIGHYGLAIFSSFNITTPGGLTLASSYFINKNTINNCETGVYINRNWNMIYTNALQIQSNNIDVTGTGTYCNRGLWMQDVAGNTPISTPSNAVSVKSNTIKNCEINAMLFDNVKRSLLVQNNNELSVKLFNTPPIFPQNRQVIRLNACDFASVRDNANIKTTNNSTIPSSTSNFITGIWLSQSTNSTVACNSMRYVDICMVFDQPSPNSNVTNNVMDKAQIGLVLANGGSIGTQGSPTLPSGNRWGLNNSNGITLAHTYTFNTTGANTASILYCRPNANPSCSFGGFKTFPCNNQTNGPLANAYQAPTGLQTASGFSLACLLIIGPPVLKIANVVNAININGATNFVDNIRFRQRRFSFNSTKEDNTGTLMGNTTINTFYTQTQPQNIGLLTTTEDLINQQQYSSAKANNLAATSTNTVEANYKLVYDKVLEQLTDTGYVYTASDITQLESIAQLCIQENGEAVTMARALLASIKKEGVTYNNDCFELTFDNGSGNRMMQPQTANDNVTINSINIYPNPNNGTFTIEHSKSKEVLTLNIMSIIGEIVYSETLNSEASVTQITTEKLETGIYLISISNQNGSIIYNNKINIIK